MSSTLPTLRPVLSFNAALLQRAQTVRVVFFDVDGVLTDGGLLFSDQGETLKRFNTLTATASSCCNVRASHPRW